MPKVSIVIPTYNRKKLVSRALRSILKQTFSDFEIILIDDGSTDGSKEVLQEFASRDSRIKLISQENAGVGVSRHRGITESQAPFVAFLDSDDWWDEKYLENQLGLLQDAPDDVVAVVCNGTAIEPDKPDVSLFEEVWYSPPSEPTVIDNPRELWEPFQVPYLQGSIFKRDALVRMKAFSLHLSSDDDFETFVRMSFAGRFIVNPEHLWVQDRGRDGGESFSGQTKLKPGFFEARCFAARFAFRHDHQKILKKKDKQAYLKAYRSWLRALAAEKKYLQIIRLTPEVLSCGFHLKSVLFALLMLTGPLGSALWETLSEVKAGNVNKPMVSKS